MAPRRVQPDGLLAGPQWPTAAAWRCAAAPDLESNQPGVPCSPTRCRFGCLALRPGRPYPPAKPAASRFQPTLSEDDPPAVAEALEGGGASQFGRGMRTLEEAHSRPDAHLPQRIPCHRQSECLLPAPKLIQCQVHGPDQETWATTRTRSLSICWWIGACATGATIALGGRAPRPPSGVLVEAVTIALGTSSRKHPSLLHGWGARALIWSWPCRGNLLILAPAAALVREALGEPTTGCKAVPFLAQPLELLLPHRKPAWPTAYYGRLHWRSTTCWPPAAHQRQPLPLRARSEAARNAPSCAHMANGASAYAIPLRRRPASTC